MSYAKFEDFMAKCPKCKNQMKRKSHPKNWRPKFGQPYYFAYWDFCQRCKHVQHYEAAKVQVGRVPAQRDLDRMANVPRTGKSFTTSRENFDWIGEPEPYPGAAPWE